MSIPSTFPKYFLMVSCVVVTLAPFSFVSAADLPFTTPPASRCVSAAMKTLHAQMVARAKKDAKAIPMTESSPEVLKAAYQRYTQGVDVAWAAIEAPYCGFDTVNKGDTPQHSYMKTVNRVRATFLEAVKRIKNGKVVVESTPLPTVTTTKTVTPSATKKADVQKKRSALSRGMRGDLVNRVQELLAKDHRLYPEGLVTGYFGPATEKAVIRFQKKAGLLTDGWQGGTVGKQTWAKLENAFGNK